MFDYLIQNGTLIDGTGAPVAAGDVAIKDGKIAAVGDLKDASAGTVLDAAGKYVTPGFTVMPTRRSSARISASWSSSRA